MLSDQAKLDAQILTLYVYRPFTIKLAYTSTTPPLSKLEHLYCWTETSLNYAMIDMHIARIRYVV